MATFEPAGFFVPAFGDWTMTVPFLAFFLPFAALAAFFVSLPTPQCALASAFLAFASVRPVSLGTTHLVAAGVLTGGLLAAGLLAAGVVVAGGVVVAPLGVSPPPPPPPPPVSTGVVVTGCARFQVLACVLKTTIWRSPPGNVSRLK